MKKIIILMVLITNIVCLYCFASCADNASYNVSSKVLKQFDLSDEQEYWNADSIDNFDEDRVRVVFKKTTTYPELSVDDFPLDNASRIEYIDLRPNDALTELNADYLKNFRQIADIYLQNIGKEKVLEMIDDLEKLPFVKLASAVYDPINPPADENTPQIDEFISIENISMQFDVTEKNVFWSGSIDDDFKDDRLYIIFKRTYTYPELTINDFNFSNASGIDYKYAKPATSIEDCSIKYLLFSYRQIACIYLEEIGKDKVIEAVEYFRKLDFIKCATPDINQYPGEDVAE